MFSEPERAAEILCHFESLGGRRHGCEFGLVQRQAGLEPLGWLRWSQIAHGSLIAALDTDLAGVGSPEQTELHEWNGVFMVRDARFNVNSHTHQSVNEMAPADVLRQACRRHAFLARKLLDDLRAAEKIFVYRETTCVLTEAEMRDLYRAVTRFGGASLLIGSYADEANPNGSVREIAAGLYVGYFNRFGLRIPHHERDESEAVWLAVCRGALEMAASRMERLTLR